MFTKRYWNQCCRIALPIFGRAKRFPPRILRLLLHWLGLGKETLHAWRKDLVKYFRARPSGDTARSSREVQKLEEQQRTLDEAYAIMCSVVEIGNQKRNGETHDGQGNSMNDIQKERQAEWIEFRQRIPTW